jgi:asparagine synthase (glutamine-hydrolysing)
LQNIENGKKFDKHFYFPFLDKEVVDFCLNLPYEMKINSGIRKFILRELGVEIGLSKEVAYQPKKAAQYGSGIIWEMKKIAKDNGVHISRYVRDAV